MQRLEGLLRKAVQDYEMIAPGDRVCVGVSGGKDSVALTVALGHLRRYLGVPFEVMAVTLDPRFGGVEADYQPLADLFAQEGIPYEIRRTDIGPVVFDYRKEPNPCALCAKMRRGALHAAAQEIQHIPIQHHPTSSTRSTAPPMRSSSPVMATRFSPSPRMRSTP